MASSWPWLVIQPLLCSKRRGAASHEAQGHPACSAAQRQQPGLYQQTTLFEQCDLAIPLFPYRALPLHQPLRSTADHRSLGIHDAPHCPPALPRQIPIAKFQLPLEAHADGNNFIPARLCKSLPICARAFMWLRLSQQQRLVADAGGGCWLCGLYPPALLFLLNSESTHCPQKVKTANSVGGAGHAAGVPWLGHKLVTLESPPLRRLFTLLDLSVVTIAAPSKPPTVSSSSAGVWRASGGLAMMAAPQEAGLPALPASLCGQQSVEAPCSRAVSQTSRQEGSGLAQSAGGCISP